MEKNITERLNALRSHLEEQEFAAGELDALNDTTIADDVDAYFNEMIDQLTANYDVSDDEAMDFIFDVADEMAEEGLLPEMPDDDDDEALAAWLGTAKTAALHIHVAEAARESAE